MKKPAIIALSYHLAIKPEGNYSNALIYKNPNLRPSHCIRKLSEQRKLQRRLDQIKSNSRDKIVTTGPFSLLLNLDTFRSVLSYHLSGRPVRRVAPPNQCRLCVCLGVACASVILLVSILCLAWGSFLFSCSFSSVYSGPLAFWVLAFNLVLCFVFLRLIFANCWPFTHVSCINEDSISTL